MALEVKANKEIKEVKLEIFMGMGIRELFIFLVTIIIVAIIFIAVRIPAIILCYATSPLIAAATMLVAYKPCGMNAERFFAAMVKSLLINGKKLVNIDKEMEKKACH